VLRGNVHAAHPALQAPTHLDVSLSLDPILASMRSCHSKAQQETITNQKWIDLRLRLPTTFFGAPFLLWGTSKSSPIPTEKFVALGWVSVYPNWTWANYCDIGCITFSSLSHGKSIFPFLYHFHQYIKLHVYIHIINTIIYYIIIYVCSIDQIQWVCSIHTRIAHLGDFLYIASAT
jgi:hypothetical protein